MTDPAAPAPDGYDTMYAAKLWSLVPELYRSADSPVLDEPGPLQELLTRIAGQVAVVRRGIDRLWEDQSIESCDDWVIAYLADLVATNLVPGMDARGQRLDVANTIDYRRRKGTLGLLEQLAADVTGWDARVVEMFRRLARRRHMIDPPLGWPADDPDPPRSRQLQSTSGLVGLLSGTPLGGFADLRSPVAAASAGAAFDEYSHRADVRPGLGAVGWYGIPKIGVFLWRHVSLGVDRATPVPVTGCPDHYAFDPTGRQVALFAVSGRSAQSYGENWVSPTAPQLPGPISQLLYDAVRAGHESPPPTGAYPDPTASFWPASLSVSQLGAGTPLAEADVSVWPEVGRLAVPAGTGGIEAGYRYGLFTMVGVGPYDRRVQGAATPADPLPVTQVPGGSATVLAGALAALAPAGTVAITDGLTSTAVAAVGSTATPAIDVTIRARPSGRAVIRLPAGAGPFVLTGSSADADPAAQLRLEGILFSGQDVVLRGTFDQVTISCCTLDPGSSGDLLDTPTLWADAVDGTPLVPSRLIVEGTVRSLVLDRCICGPVRTRLGGTIEEIEISDSIVQALPSSDGGELTGPAELFDANELANLLHFQREPLSVFLAGQLDPATAAAVAAHVAGTSVDTVTVAGLVAMLNAVIGRPALWDPSRFAAFRLLASTVSAAEAAPTGAALARVNRELLAEAYPLALADLAVGTGEGSVSLTRSTVLGLIHVHRLDASESILGEVATAEDTQDGCVRFSAWSSGSVLPRRYECAEIPAQAPLFVSRRYGEAAYCELSGSADDLIVSATTAAAPSILTGAENSSEMGAFAAAGAPVKERSLLVKYAEYMPAGIIPVPVHVPGPDPDGERRRARPWPPT
jgi:hypothetical protein